MSALVTGVRLEKDRIAIQVPSERQRLTRPMAIKRAASARAVLEARL